MVDPIDRLKQFGEAFADDPESPHLAEMIERLKSQPPAAPIEREAETPFEKLYELVDEVLERPK